MQLVNRAELTAELVERFSAEADALGVVQKVERQVLENVLESQSDDLLFGKHAFAEAEVVQVKSAFFKFDIPEKGQLVEEEVLVVRGDFESDF